MGAHHDLVTSERHHCRCTHRGQRYDAPNVVEAPAEVGHDRLRRVGIAAGAVQEEVDLALLDVRARFHEASDVAEVDRRRLRVYGPSLVPGGAVVDDGSPSVLGEPLQVAPTQKISGPGRRRRSAGRCAPAARHLLAHIQAFDRALDALLSDVANAFRSPFRHNQDDGSTSGGDASSKGVADGSGSTTSSLPFVVVRDAQAGAGHVVDGSPIQYNTPYDVTDRHGTFSETMAPGGCSGILTQRVQFMYDHGGLVLARAPGTLKLWDSADGLRCRAMLDPGNAAAADVYRAVARGDVTQMSVGFVVAAGGDEWNDAYTQRRITRIGQLIDVSAVGPAGITDHLDQARGSDPAKAGRMREQARARIRQLRSRR